MTAVHLPTLRPGLRRRGLAILLVLHGVAHLVGTSTAVQALRDSTSTGYLGDSWYPGRGALAVLALAWFLAAAAQWLSAAAIWTDRRGWPTWLAAATVFSLALSLLALPDASAGVVLDLGLLAGLVWFRAPALEPAATSPAAPVAEADERTDRWRMPTSTSTRVLVAAILVAAFAALTGWLTPRGPLTTGHAILTGAGAIAVGLGVGLVVRRRWALLATPVLYALVFEVVRLDTVGATVDTIQVTSMLGMMAFAVGRGAHALLVLFPLSVGVGWGLAVAGHLGWPGAPRPRVPGRLLLGVATFALVAGSAVLVQPATTAPILGDDGQPLPGSIAELTTVELGGVEQALMIRGANVDAPVLLHLAGGPGGTDLGAMRADTSLEQHFVVVTWDQRGTGKSYASSIDPTEAHTLDQAATDTIQLASLLAERFDEESILLMANSWGTLPGVLAIHRHPELFHAYVGTGQMVSPRATDQMFWEDTLAWAESTGRDGLAERLRDTGPPPYADLTDYELTVAYEHQWNAYPGVDDLDEMPFNTFVPENTLMDRLGALRGMFDVNSLLYPQLQDVDLRDLVTRVEVPVHVVLGEHEARGRDVLARDWFAGLQAPGKELVEMPGTGHRPSFEDPAAFTELMVRVAEESGLEIE